MIRRVMLISIEDPSAEHLDRMRTVLTRAAGEVAGIESSVVHDAIGYNNSPYALVWETVFADDAAIERYRDHPYHTGAIRDLFTPIKFQTATAFMAG